MHYGLGQKRSHSATAPESPAGRAGFRTVMGTVSPCDKLLPLRRSAAVAEPGRSNDPIPSHSRYSPNRSAQLPSHVSRPPLLPFQRHQINIIRVQRQFRFKHSIGRHRHVRL